MNYALFKRTTYGILIRLGGFCTTIFDTQSRVIELEVTHFGLAGEVNNQKKKSARFTCQFPFPHPLPERFGLPDVPVFDFGRKAAEKFVLAKAGHSTMHIL